MKYELTQTNKNGVHTVPFEIPDVKGKYRIKIITNRGEFSPEEDIIVNNKQNEYDVTFKTSILGDIKTKILTPSLKNGGSITPPSPGDELGKLPLADIKRLKEENGVDYFEQYLGQNITLSTNDGEHSFKLIGYGCDGENLLTFMCNECLSSEKMMTWSERRYDAVQGTYDDIGCISWKENANDSRYVYYYLKNDFAIDEKELVADVTRKYTSEFYVADTTGGVVGGNWIDKIWELYATTNSDEQLKYFIPSIAEINGTYNSTNSNLLRQYQYFSSDLSGKLTRKRNGTESKWFLNTPGTDKSGLVVSSFPATMGCVNEDGSFGAIDVTKTGTNSGVVPFFCI